MKLDVKLLALVCLTICTLVASVPPAVAQDAEYELQLTYVEVYRDGVVRITQMMAVNETYPVVTVPLFGSSANNFIILDENLTVLDYELLGNSINVYTLGTAGFSVQYETAALTTKEFDVWSLVLDTPVNVTVILPEDSTIIDLNKVPTSIDTMGNKIMLELAADHWVISYTFPLVPPAEFVFSEIEVTNKDSEVIISVEVTNTGGQSGSVSVPLKINQTAEDEKTVTLDAGQSTTVQFTVNKAPGTYTAEINGESAEFTVDGSSANLTDFDYIIIAIVGIGAVMVVVFIFLRKRGPNVQKVLKNHNQLNNEEKEVIHFLAEKDGKAFEAEIREHFPHIPRTSLWRLVRRLEKLEIVEVKKIGNENQVELKK